jgi:hypothetical protein
MIFPALHDLLDAASARMDRAGIPNRDATTRSGIRVAAAHTDIVDPCAEAKAGSIPAVPTAPVRERICGLCLGSGWSPLTTRDAAGEQGQKCGPCDGTGRIWFSVEDAWK